eukprot:TRINITY_DN2645_c0_g1_i15.p1 TRINITY_DN2645_c0_g1~~TRINITY_DN2645_c0_g1_i15.p1  ORF type:complete len:126 (-),score=10.94 TRINITY_DN2645_c0_g1_i15:482-859(-)
MLYYLKFGVRKKRSGKGQKKKRRDGEKQVWKRVFRDNFSQIQSADLRAMRTWVDIPETTRKLVWQKYFFNVIHAYERGLNSSAGCVVTDLGEHLYKLFPHLLKIGFGRFQPIQYLLNVVTVGVMM